MHQYFIFKIFVIIYFTNQTDLNHLYLLVPIWHNMICVLLSSISTTPIYILVHITFQPGLFTLLSILKHSQATGTLKHSICRRGCRVTNHSQIQKFLKKNTHILFLTKYMDVIIWGCRQVKKIASV